MAEEEVNRFLFLLETGQAVHFYMPPCRERARLKPMIEDRGGTINSKVEPECIKLAAPGQTVRGNDLVRSKYVTDCIEGDELLDVGPYRIDPANYKEDDGEVVSDFESGEVSNVMRVSARHKQGRQKYLLSEDMKILRYVLEEKLHRETSGNKMWKEMAVLKIVNHPWQSIRDRYRRFIIPNINSYQLKPHEMVLLSNTFLVAEDSDEYTSDSRIRKSPRKTNSPRKPSTPNRDRSLDIDSSTPPRKRPKRDSNNEAIRSPAKKNTSLLPDIDVGLDDLDRELLAMCTDDNSSGQEPIPSTSKGQESEHQKYLKTKRNEQPQYYSSGSEEPLEFVTSSKNSKKSNGVKIEDDADVGELTHPRPHEEGTETSITKNVNSKVKNTRIPDSPSKRPDACESPTSAELHKTRQSEKSSMPLNEDTDSQKTKSQSSNTQLGSGTSCFTINSTESQPPERNADKQKAQTVQDTTDAEATVNAVREAFMDHISEAQKITTKQKTKVVGQTERILRSSPKKTAKHAGESGQKTTEEKGKKPKQHLDFVEEEDTRPSNENNNNAASIIRGFLKRSPQHGSRKEASRRDHGESREGMSEPKEDVEKSQSLISPPRKSKKVCVRDDDETEPDASTTSEEKSQSSETEMLTPKEETRKRFRQASNAVKLTCKWLGLEKEELLHVLWKTSGNLNHAIKWIFDGGDDSAVPVWNQEDDDLLESADGDQMKKLEDRYGQAAVGDRLVFLAENLVSNAQ